MKTNTQKVNDLIKQLSEDCYCEDCVDQTWITQAHSEGSFTECGNCLIRNTIIELNNAKIELYKALDLIAIPALKQHEKKYNCDPIARVTVETVKNKYKI